jgi:hypothetical protein
MDLGGLITVAEPESPLMENKPLSIKPLPTDVILCKAKKLQMICFEITYFESWFKSKNVFNVHKS